MRQTKKLVALVMATAMVMSSSLAVFAATNTTAPATGSAVGTGSIEGYVDKNVFTVDLPATVDVSFKLDPQELLLATSNTATLDGSALSAGYGAKILFADAANYTSKSKDLTIVNLSTFDVDVAMTANITGLASPEAVKPYDVKVVDDLSGEAATAITMKLTPTTAKVPGGNGSYGSATNVTALTGTALTTDGITVTNTIPVMDDTSKAYEIKKSGDAYTYTIKSDLTGATFNQITYNLSGTVNTDADWTNFNANKAQLKVELTYSVDKANNEATTEATTAYGVWEGGSTYMSADAEGTQTFAGLTSASQISNFKLNGVDCAFNVDANGWISVTDAQANATNPVGDTWTFTFTYNGVNYKVDVV